MTEQERLEQEAIRTVGGPPELRGLASLIPL
jgi:hypothetical protein